MSSRVAPFGYPRINGYLLLPEAFRSLSRPSSAPDARHSPCALSSLTYRRSHSDLSENSWFSLRIMQLYKDRNCMSPCILSDAVPQSICFLCVSTEKPLCCLTCFCHIVQFSRCRSPSASFRLSPAQLPTAFAVRFEDPIFRSGLQIQRQIAWWARVGSNHRPYDYQSYALAS